MLFNDIVVLTGAGISAESGIPVFRGETGLWENEPVEAVATYEGYARDRQRVHEFYNRMRRNTKTRQPNPAHLALQRLEQECDGRGFPFTLVTQNIDNLHEKAGSRRILHMHGELYSLLCEGCERRFDFGEDSSPQQECPHCHRALLRPDIVWFGETPYFMDEIQVALMKCRLFMAIGTSGVVYPAAGFCALARRAGACCVEFNLERSQVAGNFHCGIYGKAGTTLVKFVDTLVAHGFDLEPGELSSA